MRCQKTHISQRPWAEIRQMRELPFSFINNNNDNNNNNNNNNNECLGDNLISVSETLHIYNYQSTLFISVY